MKTSLQNIFLTSSAKIMLKHKYRPLNLWYTFRYAIMYERSKQLAILKLVENSCISENLNITKLGCDKAQIVIEEDYKFLLPNLLSSFAIIISVLALFISYLTYLG